MLAFRSHLSSARRFYSDRRYLWWIWNLDIFSVKSFWRQLNIHVKQDCAIRDSCWIFVLFSLSTSGGHNLDHNCGLMAEEAYILHILIIVLRKIRFIWSLLRISQASFNPHWGLDIRTIYNKQSWNMASPLHGLSREWVIRQCVVKGAGCGRGIILLLIETASRRVAVLPKGQNPKRTGPDILWRSKENKSFYTDLMAISASLPSLAKKDNSSCLRLWLSPVA